MLAGKVLKSSGHVMKACKSHGLRGLASTAENYTIGTFSKDARFNGHCNDYVSM